ARLILRQFYACGFQSRSWRSEPEPRQTRVYKQEQRRDLVYASPSKNEVISRHPKRYDDLSFRRRHPFEAAQTAFRSWAKNQLFSLIVDRREEVIKQHRTQNSIDSFSASDRGITSRVQNAHRQVPDFEPSQDQ